MHRLGTRTRRAAVLSCDQRLSADNQRRISFILLADLVGCAVAIANLLRSESGVALSHLNVHILAASAILGAYFFRLLGYIAGSNAQQRAHSELLLRAKAAVVHRRWESIRQPSPARAPTAHSRLAPGSAQAWHQPYAAWNGSANVYVTQYLARLEELEREIVEKEVPLPAGLEADEEEEEEEGEAEGDEFGAAAGAR